MSAPDANGINGVAPASALSNVAIVLGVVWVLLGITDARAQTPVSLELVLAIDTSESVDGFEFNLLRKGITTAFRSPEVIELIELQDGVAVAIFQWSSRIDRRFMTPWRLLRTEADCLSFATLVEGTARDPHRGFTAIGEALDFGLRALAENSFQGRQSKIDLSGDGRNNSGRDPAVARRAAKRLGIQINGLPIITTTYEGTPDLDTYFLEEVIQGPGAFVEIADDYDDFARAFRRKLIREITPAISGIRSSASGPG